MAKKRTQIEAIYKCRCCHGTISIEDCIRVFTMTDGRGGSSYKLPLILESTHCPHCCLKQSNGSTVTVVADLVKQIRGE